MSSALSLHHPCCDCCLFLRTTPFLLQQEPRPLWVEGEIHGSLHYLLLWYGQGMTPQMWMDVPAVSNSTICHHADFNVIPTLTTIMKQSYYIQPTSTVTTTNPQYITSPSATGPFTQLYQHWCCEVAELPSMIAIASSLHHHLLDQFLPTIYLYLRTLSHHQCPSSSFDHERCTTSSHWEKSFNCPLMGGCCSQLWEDAEFRSRLFW